MRVMALSAVKGGGSIDIVLWNYQIHQVISFAAIDFMRGEDLPPDAEIIAAIEAKTSEQVFLAHGATNIELALEV